MEASETFTKIYDEKILPLMDKIDRVRSVITNVDEIVFPSVVVVGDQSSGKSTLLESLSLIELPRGDGIVTRCPLVLRLRKSNERRVYHVQGDKRILLDETELNIRKYIEAETEKLAGPNKNVIKDLIELQVEDPAVRNLTIVDLPGIARNPINDQPKDIHTQTTNLIRHFIRPEGSVILCIFPANVDVATVESITLAREFDPTGIRTIGVITKADLAPNRSLLCQQLLMEKKDVLSLKLGFVAVRNRSADEAISLEDARVREKEFFRDHIASSVVGWHCLGIESLINRLADLYSDRVKEMFPKIRADISEKAVSVREKLSKLPESLESPRARLVKYYELVNFYVENILKPKYDGSDGEYISLLNKLHDKFTQFEEKMAKQRRNLFTPEYQKEVTEALASCSGEQLANFLPYRLQKRLVDKRIDQLWKVTDILINECFSTTLKLLLHEKDTQKDMLVVKLKPAIDEIVTLHMNNTKQTVYNQLQEMIRLEKHDPYTLNQIYMEDVTKLLNANSENATLVASQVNHILASIVGYWDVLVKRFMDYVVLSIRAGCVFDVVDGIRKRLIRIPKEQIDFVDTCLADDESITKEKKQLKQTLERLEKIHTILGRYNLHVETNGIRTEELASDESQDSQNTNRKRK